MVKVTIINLQKKIPIRPKRIREAVLKILSSEGVKKSCRITICLINDSQIKELNLMYLGKYTPTDVLSFDISSNGDELVADIVISADMAKRNARAYGTSPLYELYLYAVHGILHLLGYDDNNKKNKSLMQEKEEHFCKKIFNMNR